MDTLRVSMDAQSASLPGVMAYSLCELGRGKFHLAPLLNAENAKAQRGAEFFEMVFLCGLYVSKKNRTRRNPVARAGGPGRDTLRVSMDAQSASLPPPGHRPGLHQPINHHPSTKLLHRQLALNLKLLNSITQRRSRDAEEFCGLDLVTVGFLEGVDDEFALDGGDDF